MLGQEKGLNYFFVRQLRAEGSNGKVLDGRGVFTMTVRRQRKAASHTATGKALAMTAAATSSYPAWPRDLVELPTKRRDHQRTLGWYDHLLKHRTPEAWQSADPARVALLARTLTAWERESWLLMEREGGDAGLADKWRSAIGQLCRQLGLSVAIRDPRLTANDAMVRGELAQAELDLEGDDLLARPRVN